jgi:hypothetical protein
MPCNKCAFICTIQECHLSLMKRILQYVRGTSKLGLHLFASSSSTIAAYSDADWAGCPDTQRIAFFLVIHWCLGHQRGRPLCPGQLRRLNTVLWQMLLQSAFGCDNCSVSSIVPFRRPRSRFVTTSQLCTCRPILFITGGRSTSNWTFTSSANMLQWVSSTSSTF